MKVAIIVESFPKLSETFVVNHIKGLIDEGAEVKIFAFYNLNEGRIHPVVNKYHLKSKTRYKPVEPLNKIGRSIKAIFLILRYIPQYPKAILQSINIFKLGKDAFRMHYLFEAATFFTKEKFDLVHCHFGNTAEKVALFQQWGLLNAPLVTSFHGYDLDDKSFRDSNEYLNLKKRVSVIISNSTYTQMRLIELGFDAKKIKILPVYFDTSYFKRKGSNSDSFFTILTVGRLVEFKGIEYSIKALSIVKKDMKIPFKYIIVGTGPLEEKLQMQIDELDLNDCIKLVGQKTQAEILELMENSDIFMLNGIMTNDGRVENQGLVIQEAQSMNLPVIVSDLGGVSEGMLNGISGFLLPPKDVNAIADKINYLYTHPEERMKMGIAGRKYVEDKYSISQSTQKLLGFYKTLLNDRHN